MRENAEAKGRRYLLEGRLVIEQVNSRQVVASCRGAGRVYQVTCRRGAWACTCPALGRCAHLVALQLVTNAPGETSSGHRGDEGAERGHAPAGGRRVA